MQVIEARRSEEHTLKLELELELEPIVDIPRGPLVECAARQQVRPDMPLGSTRIEDQGQANEDGGKEVALIVNRFWYIRPLCG